MSTASSASTDMKLLMRNGFSITTHTSRSTSAAQAPPAPLCASFPASVSAMAAAGSRPCSASNTRILCMAATAETPVAHNKRAHRIASSVSHFRIVAFSHFPIEAVSHCRSSAMPSRTNQRRFTFSKKALTSTNSNKQWQPLTLQIDKHYVHAPSISNSLAISGHHRLP